MNVRELFRNKLENSEVVPDDSVRNELMHKLAAKEFVRFNPSRFNMFYLGGLVAAAITTIIILTSGPSDSKTQTNSSRQEAARSVENIITEKSQNQLSSEKSAQKGSIVQNEAGNRSSGKSEKRKESENIVSKGVNKNNETLISGVPDSLRKKAISGNNVPEKTNTAVLHRTPAADFNVSVMGGCSPLKVKFINKSTSFDSCRWVFGDGGFSGNKNPEWIFDQEGEYKVVLTVYNSDGDQAVATSLITVHPRPVARFKIDPEKPVIPDDEIRFTNYSVDAVKFKWEFGDGNSSGSFEPYHKYKKYTKYNVRLITWSEYGCSDTLIVNDAFAVSGCFIEFPNAFIPGTGGPVGGFYSTKSDEAAQIFHPNTSGVNEYHLKIFSKLGILIFESNDINIGWDGYMKGQLCEPGVYIWKVRGTYKNGEPFVQMGDLTLLRN